MNGIMDVCLNSFDGDRSDDAEGPVEYYNENYTTALCTSPSGNKVRCTIDNQSSVCQVANSCQYSDSVPVKDLSERIEDLKSLYGDNYQWLFWINNIIDIDPPKILSTSVNQSDAGVDLVDSIFVDFDKLMMSSSLKTGKFDIFNGRREEYIEHKLINIWSLANYPTGYWIANEGIDDSSPSDGEMDRTKAEIRHSTFRENMSYRSQIGSGVKDIYQNCFKPSIGPACAGMSEANPTCCSGVLSANENCD